jgi:hypothetical protein
MAALLIALILALTGIVRVESPALDALAEQRAHEVAVGGLEHRDLDELDNGQWSGWGEVLAWNSGFEHPAEAAIDGWAASPKHHAILFNADYTHIGCGSEQRLTDSAAASAGWYFVCILARPVAGAVPGGGTIPNTSTGERATELVAAAFVFVMLLGVFLIRHRRP